MTGYGWRFLLLALAVVSFAACVRTGNADNAIPSNDTDGTATKNMVWLFPPEDYEMERERLRVVAALPQTFETGSVGLLLNGSDQTARTTSITRFRPKHLHTILALFHPGAGPSAFQEAISGYRLIAEFSQDKLLDGWNQLVITYRDSASIPHEFTRRFHVETRGRRVSMTVRRRHGTRLTRTSARIVLQPVDGAPALDFSLIGSQTGRMSPDGRRPRSFVLARNGEAVVWLPEGSYRAIATANPLDSIDEWLIPATGQAKHEFEIRREVDLPSVSTVDFHVHSAVSSDSYLPLEERVWSFLAAGIDVMVASDHRTVADYRPTLRALGSAADGIRVIPGVETNLKSDDGSRLGHWNVWPLARPHAHDSPHPEIVSRLDLRKLIDAPHPPAEKQSAPAAFYDAIRHWAHEHPTPEMTESADDEPMIQLNHPRGLHFHPADPISRVHDWFNHAAFDPDKTLDSDENRQLMAQTPAGTTALDFDSLEIWNRNSRHLYVEVRKDWFSLLNQGLFRAATADTDTHGMSAELPAYPMNLVFLPPDVQGGPGVTTSDLNDAVRAGKLIGTDGPVPLLEVSSAQDSGGPGDLVEAASGKLTVGVEIRAAHWVPIGPVTVWVNGVKIDTTGASSKTVASGHLLFEMELRLDRDAWILVEVGHMNPEDDGTTLPGDYGLLSPFGFAFAFTNPVFVDVDGNGRFDPPGLS